MDYRVKGVWLVLSGIAIGAIMGSGVANRWGSDVENLVSSPNFATLMAGLGGAVIGGLISYFTARQTTAVTLRRDQDVRLATENASALNILVTTMQISNRLYTFMANLKPAAEASDEEPWQRFQASPEQDPLALRYNASDFVPFINAKAADLVHRCFLLSERYDSIEASHRAYSRLRLTLEELLVPHSEIENGAMVTKLPPEMIVRARYLMNQLNSLISQMHNYCERDLRDSKDIIREMNRAYKSHFGEKATFTLAFDDAAGEPSPKD